MIMLQLGDTYMGLDNITQVIHKAEKLFQKLETGLSFSDRLFDPNVWDPVLRQLNSFDITNLGQLE